MKLIQQLTRELEKKFSSQFVRNLSWMGMSELFPRFLRLGVTVVLAHQLSDKDYGLGGTVLTVNEFARVFMDVGITAKIIQADEQELEDICNSAYWLNWLVFSGLFVTQCLVAFIVAYFSHSSQLILPICIAAIPYLAWPLVAIRFALIQRENRLKVVAITHTLAISIDYIASAVLALSGFGMWAFVLPNLIVSPISIFTYYNNHSWRHTTGITTKYWKEILNFGKNILGVSLLKTLRNNLDNLIVVSFLGYQQFGIYFFGFNAGLGISLSLINALNSAVLPHLCAGRSEWSEFKRRYLNSLKIMGLIIVPLVVLQAGLAPFYGPIVFSEKRLAAIPILMIICLSAIPRPFADAASQLLVAIGKPSLDLRWNIVFTVIFTVALLIGVQWQVMGVAIAVLSVHLICLPLFAVWATRYVFPKMEGLNKFGL